MHRAERAVRHCAPALVLLYGLFRACSGGRALPAISDDIPFRLNWPGPDFSLPTTGIPYKDDHYIIMTTADKETYKCLLPITAGENQEEEGEYKGPSPGELLDPLFKQTSCSYRIESYWTYEVCHGKHIRQYHEEKEAGQQTNLQEYYLGNTVKKSSSDTGEKQEEEKAAIHKAIPTKNIEGQMTPYFPIEMGNGTPCSLKQNQARTTTVMYICHPDAKHEILSVAEVITCEYEVVILTPLLCTHPNYRFKTSPINDIFCQSMPGSPLRPQSLEKLEQQREMIRPPFKPNKEDEQQGLKDKFSTIHKPVTVGSQQHVTVGTTHISKLTDEQLIKEFLTGSYCFHGGVGWWKYEFCYGKYVHQYHEDKDTGKTTLVVGTWKEDQHLDWAKKNVARLYHPPDEGVQTVRQVSFYIASASLYTAPLLSLRHCSHNKCSRLKTLFHMCIICEQTFLERLVSDQTWPTFFSHRDAHRSDVCNQYSAALYGHYHHCPHWGSQSMCPISMSLETGRKPTQTWEEHKKLLVDVILGEI